jgi:hypothetical protein
VTWAPRLGDGTGPLPEAEEDTGAQFDPAAVPQGVRAAYRRAGGAAVTSIVVAGFRASAGIGLTHDRADLDAGSQLACP